jgi:hypothetical protein
LGIESNSPIFPPKFTAPSGGDFVGSIFSIIYVETKISFMSNIFCAIFSNNLWLFNSIEYYFFLRNLTILN